MREKLLKPLSTQNKTTSSPMILITKKTEPSQSFLNKMMVWETQVKEDLQEVSQEAQVEHPNKEAHQVADREEATRLFVSLELELTRTLALFSDL